MACKQKGKNQRLLLRGFLLVSFARKYEVDIKDMMWTLNKWIFKWSIMIVQGVTEVPDSYAFRSRMMPSYVTQA